MSIQDTPIVVKRLINDSDEYRASLEECTIQELQQKFCGVHLQAPLRRGMKDSTYKRVLINKLIEHNNVVVKYVLQHPNGINRHAAKTLRHYNVHDIQVQK